MRFSLQEVKKSVQRRSGELSVSLHFLRPGEAEQEIARLIAYHEKALGQPQRCFSTDEARATVGDYRLANCLLATLSHWYNWRSPTWSDVVQERHATDLGEIGSPLQLRLALYTYVNERYQGFLTSEMREEALAHFSARYHLGNEDLAYLLALDSEDEAILSRLMPQPPTPSEVATLYNQWTFEAALFNASSVHFLIDCQAFLSAQAPGAQAVFSVESGLGAAIKRLCYLARMLGVYYDLAYEPGEIVQQHSPAILHLTLYGPQDVTGVPQQYGLRLARLCRLLLGYNSRNNQEGGSGAKGKKTLRTAIIKAEANIHFLQRAYRFEMDAHLLALLPSQSVGREQSGPPQDDLYDSSVEQHFAEAFLGMARSRGVDGWQLEREPEPLLLSQSILIPDFALTRGKQRVYAEVLGFWTPSYRERKIQKLQQLQGRKDLLLIIPEEAREAFTSIAPYFPVAYYNEQIGLSGVLQLLRQHYDDFAERLSSIKVENVREQVRSDGLLTEENCYEHLHSYRRSEIQQAAQLIIDEQIAFLPGLGLYDLTWMRRFQEHCLLWLGEREEQRLSDLLTEIRAYSSLLQQSEDTVLEALLAQLSEIQIERDSLFEARVRLVGRLALEEEGATKKRDIVENVESVENAAKKPLKEKQAAAKKRIKSSGEAMFQENLW